MMLRARQFTFTFPRPALIMGVVNVTPDSFSDGGEFFDPARAVEHALALVGEGADILDLGGESTRPGAVPVSEAEELRRVMPVFEQLAGQVAVPLSIDTMKPGVARAALQAGASILNDVGGNRPDPEMWRLAAETGAGYVLMHMQGTPQTMQRNPTYRDVVVEIEGFFAERLRQLTASGVAEEQVVVDVGIGFGKTVEHNLQLLAHLRRFTLGHRPLLLGVSRKGFIGQVTGAAPAAARGPGSLACACWGLGAGVNIVRVHDVASTKQALRMMEAILAHTGP
jgi:dihydropteroate synthase